MTAVKRVRQEKVMHADDGCQEYVEISCANWKELVTTL